ncbi:MAG: dihydroneopterin aldolase family protein [Thermoplasmata archaeon]|nr:dihydroneopterin aldolase family protein [Thermoplasmata archaeon]
MARSSVPRANLSRREALLFEAGIKLGGLFHQYLGVPVSARTAPGLARTIERAVALQPFVAGIRVRIDPTLGGPLGRGRFAYRYLMAEMLEVRVRLVDRDVEVTARLAHRPDLRYPLMSVVSVRAPRNRRSGPRPANRSRRTAGP